MSDSPIIQSSRPQWLVNKDVKVGTKAQDYIATLFPEKFTVNNGDSYHLPDLNVIGLGAIDVKVKAKNYSQSTGWQFPKGTLTQNQFLINESCFIRAKKWDLRQTWFIVWNQPVDVLHFCRGDLLLKQTYKMQIRDRQDGRKPLTKYGFDLAQWEETSADHLYTDMLMWKSS